MFFITSRMPTVDTEPELNKNFIFDLKDNSSGRELYRCRRDGEGMCEEIGSKNLLAEVKGSKYRQVLLYIHGFSNLLEDVFKNVTEF